MKRLLSVATVVAVSTALAAGSALAKGANEALITGPGIGTAISLGGEGGAGGDRLSRLAEDAGFYPAVFVTSPNSMRPTRPAGDLGPRYTITYAMPGPSGVAQLRQDVYPYAKPSPLTFMAPGQRYFATEKTAGGWYVASASLKNDLVAFGLPESPPAVGGSGMPWTPLAIGAAGLIVLLAAIGAVVVARRRWPSGSHATT